MGEPELSAVLLRAKALAERLYEEASVANGRALTAAEEARAIRKRVQRHLRSAQRHEKAASRHDDARKRWTGRGEDELADFERRTAQIYRDHAQLERERAAHENELRVDDSGT